MAAVTRQGRRRPHATATRTNRTLAEVRLAGFNAPKSIVIVDELPKNASGKVLNCQLREQVTNQRVADPREEHHGPE